MEILRTILLLGLIFHKVIWELMKRKSSSGIHQRPLNLSFKSIVKFFKVIVLVFLLFQTLFLDLFPISGQPLVLRMIGTVIYFVGLAMAVTARLQLGKNWANIEDGQVFPQQSVVTTGIYRYIRHPIYIGDILLLTGLELALNSWLVLGVIILFPIVVKQAMAEEELLNHAIPAYGTYCKRTKRFIPFII